MKIDFYVLEVASGQKSLLFACQLLEKAYTEGKFVYVHTNSREEAERMNDLLWTFRDDSFVPHDLYSRDETNLPVVQIGWASYCERSEAIQTDGGVLTKSGFARNEEASGDTTGYVQRSAHNEANRTTSVLLNLAQDIPPFFHQFQHIVEIVFSDPIVQQLARNRFKQYRDQGFEITTIKLKASEL